MAAATVEAPRSRRSRQHPQRVMWTVPVMSRRMPRRMLLAGTSLLALVLGASSAHAIKIGSGSGGAVVGAPNVAADAALAAAKQAQEAARNAAESMTRTTRALQSLQSIQAAARAAAQASQKSVTAPVTIPNGLGTGGLDPNPALGWTGANAPTQAAGTNDVNIKQTAAQAILNWKTFNVGAQTKLTFDQQGNASWVALNRVDAGTGPSQILGNVKADGTVLVINQSGIIFGGASQINVGSLIASTAGITDDQFKNSGIYSTQTGTTYLPSFTGAGGKIVVESGAEITTNVPASATSSGGYVLLMGTEVENAGSITTPKGQVTLAAGDDFVIRSGYGTDNNNKTSTTRGNEVASVIRAAAGTVTNTGLVFAQQGDITLTGHTVVQDGILLSTTSVNQRGTIHLSNSAGDSTGSVTLTGGSVTAILPELDSADPASNAQRDAIILESGVQDGLRGLAANVQFDNLGLLADRQDQSRIEIVTGGLVNFESGSLAMAQGGQIAVSAGKGPAATTGRIFVANGATIDVSGVRDVSLAMSSNGIEVNVQGNELRDSPQNRDSGKLLNGNVWVDARDLVFVPAGTGGYTTDRYYTAGGLLEVSGYVGKTEHTIGEWTALGGTIMLSAPEIIAQKGSKFDISGGSLAYQGGYLNQSHLLGSDGRIYSVNSARADLTYVAVADGFVVNHSRVGVVEVYNNALGGNKTARWENGYTVGRDAGQLILATPTSIFEGDIVDETVKGAQQTNARPGNITDGYKLGQNVVAQNGRLSIGRYTSIGLSDAYQSNVRIGDIADITAGIGAGAVLPGDRTGTIWFDAGRLSEQKLGGFSVATRDSITVDSDFTLADGGQVKLAAPIVNINADITAHAGSVTATNLLPSAPGTPILTTAGGLAQLTLASGATIDTGGVWSNALINPDDVSGQAFINGGNVTFDSTQNVTIAAGSTIDVSSGGAILANAKTKGGKGGNVTLIADDGIVGEGRLVLQGDIRGYGVNGGGALKVEAASVLIAAAGAAAAPGQVLLTPDFFTKGFSNYNINGHKGLTVANDTTINVEMPVYRLTSDSFTVPAGADPSVAMQLWTPPSYLKDDVNGTLVQRGGADVTLQSTLINYDSSVSRIDIQRGAVVNVDAGRHIAVQSPGQVTVDGALRASGGVIDVLQLNQASAGKAVADPVPGQRSVWIGDHAVIDVAAHAVTGVDNFGRRYGVVPDGGTINIGAVTDRNRGDFEIATGAEAFVVIRPGALLDASGTSEVIDLPAKSGLAHTGNAVEVASNGGTIALNSLLGLYIDGTLKASAGGAGASGGSLILTLDTGRYIQKYGGAPVPDDVRFIRELAIGMDYVASGSDGPLQMGKGRISVEQIKKGGFDTLSALSDVIRFDGNVDLTMGRELELYHGTLVSDGNSTVHLAAPHVAFRATPYWSLDGVPIYPRTDGPYATPNWIDTTTRSKLTVDADLIDLYSLQLGGAKGVIPLLSGSRPFEYRGFDAATLNSSGDIRVIGKAGGSRALELNAAQLYPVTLGSGSLAARELIRIGRTTSEIPALPYSVFGNLTLNARTIEQGGILRAPLGSITLGFAENFITPTIPVTEKVTLLDGSITSVSAKGLVIPYGGTVDDITYNYNGQSVKSSIGFVDSLTQAVILGGKAFEVKAGALLDLSGGGDLQGAGFISGRGGSVDVLTTPLVNANPAYTYSSKSNGVYAIVPGLPQGYAPIDAGAGAAPGIGRQITIPDGVPGLKAGTYTLMPASYALLPGAYRVELGNGTTVRPFAPVSVGNGTWTLTGYQGIANTSISNSLPTQMLITSGTAVRNFSQYKESAYADFLVAEAARLGAPRPVLPIDGKTLALNYAIQPSATDAALTFGGTALFDPAGTGGRSGILRVAGQRIDNNVEIIARGGPHTAGWVSIEADDLNAIGAARMVLGGFQYFSIDLNYMIAGAAVNSLAVRSGVVLEAPEIILSARAGGITVEDGVRLSTIGKNGDTPFSAADGYSYGLYDTSTNVLALSNGLLNFSTASSSSGNNPGVQVGKAELYTEGTLLFATSTAGKLTLDRDARYGAKYLSLALPTINIGENAAIDAAIAAGVLPDGLILNQQVLASLLQGNHGLGVPKVESLILSAGKSVNFFGSVALDTIDPATGKSSLAELVLNTPAVYGLGDTTDTARITTGTLIWNGLSDGVTRDTNKAPASMPPPAVVAGGPGTGKGVLDIVADEIVFGYQKFKPANSQLTLDRLALGFSTVNLNASTRITANSRNSLSVYESGTSAATYADGKLNLITPLLTGEGASINRFTAGGALVLSAPVGAATPAATNVIGAEIGLKGQTVSIASTIALPSGKLTIEANADVTLADSARIDMAGREVTMIDVKKYSWGGDVVLTSQHGNVIQAAGSVIDLSAKNNNGGTLNVNAVDAAAGTVTLNGSILGSATGQYDAGGTMVSYLGGEIDVRAQTIADFVGLNWRLTDGGVLGARSFQIKKEGSNLVIGDELKANSILVSVDGGSLMVNGRIDAGGEQVGAIRLAARDGLTLASNAVLDAHGAKLRVDSYGKPIDASNRAIVELTSGVGDLTLSSGATIDVRSADGVARGTVDLNAPRRGANDIGINAAGPLDIRGARNIAVNGMRTYTDAPDGGTGSNGKPVQVITQAYLDGIHAQSTAFIDAAIANSALQGRLAGLRSYASAFHLRPGVEIASATADGNLLVGGDLDLSGYRYASVNPNTQKTAAYGSGEVGTLALRAGGNLTISGSITDGFAPPPKTNTPDDNGWSVKGTLTSDIVAYSGTLPGGVSGVATIFPGGATSTAVLNFDITVRLNSQLRRGIAIPFEFVSNAAVNLPGWAPGGWTATANIYDASNTLIFTAGQLVNINLAAGTRFAAGTVLPSTVQGTPTGVVTIRAGLVPKGTPLNVFNANVSLNAPVVLTPNNVLPIGTNLGSGTTVQLRPTDGVKIWAIAPMLPAGSQSWSMQLTSGADMSAADGRRLNTAGTGDMVLSDLHYSGPTLTQQGISVIRTGTGDLDLGVGGNFKMQSLFGIYTAGTQSADIGANGSDPFNQVRGYPLQPYTSMIGTSVLGSANAAYEWLVNGSSSIYQAWYPQNGGNLALTVQGNATGLSMPGMNTVGNWLWRQGGDISGSPTAWWINFGSYTDSGLKGFTGFGTLGGGNIDARIGGDAGMLTSLNANSQALNFAIGGTGRVTGNTLVQTGGGDLRLQVGGVLNPLDPNLNPQMESAWSNSSGGSGGVIANLRGAVDLDAGAIGRLDLYYGYSFGYPARYAGLTFDPRPVDVNVANFARSSNGPTLVLGDAAASFSSRGDLVLQQADNPGLVATTNITPYSVTSAGATTSYAGGGRAWFSLWTDSTAIDLFAAGGNLTPMTAASADYPGTLRAVAAEGSIYYGGKRDTTFPRVPSLTLAPSAHGQLEILARDSIYAAGAVIGMSGADPAVMPTPFRAAFFGYTDSLTKQYSNLSPDYGGLLSLYAFGGNTITTNLHAGDSEPQRFYAIEGDIVGLRTGEILDFTNGGTRISSKSVNSWYVGAKPVRIIAGRDIVGSGERPYDFFNGDKPVYAQSPRYGVPSLGNFIYHANESDVSVVQAGRDIIYANFQIGGPGTFEMSAGRNIYQADQGSITSIGALATGDNRLGASIVMQAGMGAAGPDYAKLAALYLDPKNLAVTGVPLADQPGKVAKSYEQELRGWLKTRYGFEGDDAAAMAYFTALPAEQQNVFLRLVYFAELKAGGREYNDPNSSRYGSYLRGRNVIAALFPDKDADGNAIARAGDITMFGGAGVRTLFGGDIQMLTPGGRTVIGVEGKAPPASAGVVTQGSGDIAMYSRGSILLGLSRIMTTFGGSILAWSAEGDINAGRGSKSTVLFTPSKRTYDKYGRVTLSPQVPSTGAGIATLNPIPEVPAGDIDLIAPLGTIDAGEAGVRFSGDINIVANLVLNSANIVGQGNATGIPTVQGPPVVALTAAANVAGAGQQTGLPGSSNNSDRPSIILVEFLGFGGSQGSEDDERRRAQ